MAFLDARKAVVCLLSFDPSVRLLLDIVADEGGTSPKTFLNFQALQIQRIRFVRVVPSLRYVRTCMHEKQRTNKSFGSIVRVYRYIHMSARSIYGHDA